MSELFPIETPEGFSYEENFISVGEQEQLLALVAKIGLHPFNFHGFEAKRLTRSFGMSYDFSARVLKEAEPVPEAFYFLRKRVAQRAGLAADLFSQLLITDYPPGAVIGWHRDAPPFSVIAGISLLSACNFKMRPYGAQASKQPVLYLELAPRSVYIMRGEARSKWEHAISPNRSRRISLTFRTLSSK